MLATVWPVSPIVVPVLAPMDDALSSSAWTVVTVCASAGPVDGTTWKARVRWSALVPKGTTCSTPSTAASEVARCACVALTCSCVGVPGRSATTMTGPFMPGPKACAVAAYAR